MTLGWAFETNGTCIHSSVTKINSSWLQYFNLNKVKSLLLEVNSGEVYIVSNRGAGRKFLLRKQPQNPQGKDSLRIKSGYVIKPAINKIKKNWVIIKILMAYKE